MIDDLELLQRYSHGGDEAAFRELVRRHIDFVYGVAARHSGGSSRAKDIAQEVFIDLARKADRLAEYREIVGWLYISTRHAARNVVRTEARRQAREREADVIWPAPELVSDERLRPLIDDALGRLGAQDRSVILLRYFRNLTYVEIARMLGSNEDAVRRRADRALEKLRGILAQGGANSSAEALARALEAQPSIPAPSGLAVAVADGALAAWASAQRVTPGAIKLLSVFGQSSSVAAVLALAALLATGLAWRARAAAAWDFQNLVAAEQANARAAARLTAAKQALAADQKVYDDLHRQYQVAQSRAEAAQKADGVVPTSTDSELQRWAVRKLNTWHAQTDMAFVRKMGWAPDKIQTFFDYEAVESRVTGLGIGGVMVMFRGDDHLLRNSVSDGAHDNVRQGSMLNQWLGKDADHWEDFIRHNGAYEITGQLAMQLYGVEPLAADQAAALTKAFRNAGITIEPSADNWTKILAAGSGVLTPSQMAVAGQLAVARTGEDLEAPAP